MIEIFAIFLTLLSLTLFFNFPLNYFLLNNISKIRFTHNESFLINIVLNANILLLLSFFQINLNQVFFVFIFGSIFFFIKFFKEYLELINRNIFTILSFIIIFYSISIVLLKKAFLEWDGLAHWLFKSTVYFQGGTYEDLVGLPFDYYPHLGTYIWAFFWKNSLLQVEYYGRLFYVFIFIIAIFTLRHKLTKKFSEFNKDVIIFILILLSSNIFLFGGYQEYFLFVIFFTFSHFFLKFFYVKKVDFYFFPEIFLILTSLCIMWIKQEGFFYYIILNFIFLIHSQISYKKKLIYLFIVATLIILFYTIKNHYFGVLRFNESLINEETYRNIEIQYLFEKILIITKYFLISFFKYPIWIVILISFFILSNKYLLFNKTKFVFTYIMLIFIFIFAIFLNTPDDIAWLAPLTLNRIVFATSGFLIFLIIDLLNKNAK